MTRVLLVEDDMGLGDSVCRALALRGHAVSWAHDLSAAREQIRKWGPYDVVLCDYELQHADGVEWGTALLNEVIEAGSVPVTVLWSGLDRKHEVLAEMPVPPDHVLVKDLAGIDAVLEVVGAAGVAADA